MSIEIRDKTESELALPKVKSVVVDGEVVGDIEPRLYGDSLTWFASIRLGDVLGPCVGLVQGHGSTPRQAIANGIIAARRGRD